MDSSSAGTYSYGTSQKQMAELQSGRNTLSVKPVPCVTGGKVKKGGAYMDSSSAGTYSYGTSQKQMAELQSGRNTLSVKPAPCVIGGKKHHKKTQNKRKSSKRNRKSRRH